LRERGSFSGKVDREGKIRRLGELRGKIQGRSLNAFNEKHLDPVQEQPRRSSDTGE